MLKQSKRFNDTLDEFNQACEGLLCAINDNPDALKDLDYKRISPKIKHHRSVAQIGIFGIGLAWLIKTLGH